VTRDESIEATALVHATGVLLASLAISRAIHAALAHALPTLKPPVAPAEYLHLLLVFLPIWVFTAERLGIHRVDVLTGPPIERVRRVLLTQAWGLAAAALILVAAQTALNRSLIAIFFAVSTPLLLLASGWERRLVARRRGDSLVLVVGDASADTIAEIERARGRRVAQQTSADPGGLDQRLRAEPVDEVVLWGSLDGQQIRALVELAANHAVSALVPLSRAVDGIPLPLPRVEFVGRAQMLVYQRTGPSAPAVVVKTLGDRLLAAVLLAALSPFMVLIAVAVRLFVGSPILFVQRRAGFFGRPFAMLKFRTMRLGAEAELAALRPRNEMDGPVFKLADDPRVTRFGRFLRRSSLDELPQLFNVLLGQMSLVGPRPLPLDETELLTGGHRRRLSMRPGLTCLWQVSGRNDLSFREWMALDLDYVDRWSLGLDLAILLRTIPAIITGRGAR
jgi:exopolysaccharide biosynthesis polyprenyl glycosylphosphotransferase